MMRIVISLLLFFSPVSLFHRAFSFFFYTPQTWYIRADGGGLYSAARVAAGFTGAAIGCDGLGNAAYTGGTNQHCGLNDLRLLWDNQTFGGYATWIIAGGDTVVIGAGPWRIGFDTATPGIDHCFGGTGARDCFNPTIPAGTSGQHTRFLGVNHGACTSHAAMSQIFGGYGVYTAWNIANTQYVDMECIELTRHSDCVLHGVPNLNPCSTSAPYSDYDSEGLNENNSTANVFLTDMWIHGHTDRGVIGAIGGLVSCTRCVVEINGEAGWDFDNGTTMPSGAMWVFNYSQINWSGCNQQYPYVDPIPVTSCYGQSDGGYGDGVGTPAGTGLSIDVNYSSFSYNVQDAIDVGHVDTGTWTLNMTVNYFFGNGGAGPKWDGNYYNATFINNVVIANCARMSAAITGVPASFNANLHDFCRSGEAAPFNFRDGGVALVANNTYVSYAPVFFDLSCIDGPGCPTAVLKFYNNSIFGYANPAISDYGGTNIGPTVWFYQNGGPGTQDYRNVNYYGTRQTCPTGFDNGTCVNQAFVGQPTGNHGSFVESELDAFNFIPSTGSPLLFAGITYTGQPLTDYYGVATTSPPPIGAVGNGGSPPPAGVHRIFLGIKH